MEFHSELDLIFLSEVFIKFIRGADHDACPDAEVAPSTAFAQEEHE